MWPPRGAIIVTSIVHSFVFGIFCIFRSAANDSAPVRHALQSISGGEWRLMPFI
jgi:hypothetical protein